MYSRIDDGLLDSSLWADGSYEGCATAKLWIALLFEGRRDSGAVRRLTTAKAARLACIPVEIAAVAVARLTGPDLDDSSGVAEGRRLLPDPDGGPNDYIITNWTKYATEFARANKTARQRKWRARVKADAADSSGAPTPEDKKTVDGTVYKASTGRRDGDASETEDREVREVFSFEEKKSAKKSAKTIVESYVVTDELRQFARKHGQDADVLYPEWLDHFRGNGYVIGKNRSPVKDAEATLRTWIRNASKFAQESSAPRASRAGLRVVAPTPITPPRVSELTDELAATRAGGDA